MSRLNLSVGMLLSPVCEALPGETVTASPLELAVANKRAQARTLSRRMGQFGLKVISALVTEIVMSDEQSPQILKHHIPPGPC
jgi:hypothetical protein